MTSTRDTELQLSELFDRPSSPVRAKVFICATGRTGSSLLCRAMFHHGIGLPHEYFNAGHIALIGQRSGIHALADGSRLGSDSEARRAYIAALLDRRTANGIFAAKIHWGQYASYLDNPEGVELFQQAHFIHLYREDLLAQAISFHVSKETGRWGSDDTVSTPPASIPRFFDVDLIADYIKMLAESDTSWRLFFSRNAISPLTVSYERVRDDVAGVLRTIVESFGLDLPTDCFDYAEEGPNEVRDAQVPPRSEIKARFLRAHQRVIPALRGDAQQSVADMNPVEVESPRAAPPHVAANARFAADKLPEPKAPDLGTLGAENMVDQHKLVPTRRLRSRVVGPPRVLVAILAKQKEPALPLYLECIEALDYPRSSIVLYIRTNNNTDRTEAILRDWVARVGHLYAAVDFDASDVADRVEQYSGDEWNATRFKVLGQIRNASLRRALDLGCDFYFVADVDNFIRPATLRELVALDLPIVAPLLRSIIPERFYSNYHAEIDPAGYYKNCDQYYWILNRHVRGVVEVPVVNCTYLVRADVIPELTYEEESGRHEYVVFCDSARRAGIPQYLDNRQVYGYITFDEGEQHPGGGIERTRALLRGAGDGAGYDSAAAISASLSGDLGSISGAGSGLADPAPPLTALQGEEEPVVRFYGEGASRFSSTLKKFADHLRENRDRVTDLCRAMKNEGSDKGLGWHNYTLLYDFLLTDRREGIRNILEVGIDKGASLRGWREYFPNANVFGADIDERTLFSEPRISTFCVDQLQGNSIRNLFDTLGDIEFDLIIDDGLHRFENNATLIAHAHQKLGRGGLYVIEDIATQQHNLARYDDMFSAMGLDGFLIIIPHSTNSYDNCMAIFQPRPPPSQNAPKPRTISVVAPRPSGYVHSGAFTELAETLFYGFQELGYDARLVSQLSEAAGQIVVVSAHLLSASDAAQLPDGAIIYNAEVVQQVQRFPHYADLLRKHKIWDYGHENAKHVAAFLSKSVQYVPVGFVPQLARIRQKRRRGHRCPVLRNAEPSPRDHASSPGSGRLAGEAPVSGLWRGARRVHRAGQGRIEHALPRARRVRDCACGLSPDERQSRRMRM